MPKQRWKKWGFSDATKTVHCERRWPAFSFAVTHRRNGCPTPASRPLTTAVLIAPQANSTPRRSPVPLNRQIAEAVAFAVRNMCVGAYKDPARVDLPQYSAEALFEAIANAVAHRDYSMRGSRIRLSMFANRVEIQSPGALTNSLTIDELAYRQATRNEVLASVFGRMPSSGIQGTGGRLFIMERRGDGVPVIRRETRELAGRLPRFDLVGGADLRVTLPAASTEPSPARVLITVRAEDQPLVDAEVLLLFPNKTWKQATTDALGQAVVGLHTADLPMTVFAASLGFAAHCEREWLPAEGELTIELKSLLGGGAVIFPEATGTIFRASRGV